MNARIEAAKAHGARGLLFYVVDVYGRFKMRYEYVKQRRSVALKGETDPFLFYMIDYFLHNCNDMGALATVSFVSW